MERGVIGQYGDPVQALVVMEVKQVSKWNLSKFMWEKQNFILLRIS